MLLVAVRRPPGQLLRLPRQRGHQERLERAARLGHVRVRNEKLERNVDYLRASPFTRRSRLLVGGPIMHDKLFFSLAPEFQQQTAPASVRTSASRLANGLRLSPRPRSTASRTS